MILQHRVLRPTQTKLGGPGQGKNAVHAARSGKKAGPADTSGAQNHFTTPNGTGNVVHRAGPSHCFFKEPLHGRTGIPDQPNCAKRCQCYFFDSFQGRLRLGLSFKRLKNKKKSASTGCDGRVPAMRQAATRDRKARLTAIGSAAWCCLAALNSRPCAGSLAEAAGPGAVYDGAVNAVLLLCSSFARLEAVGRPGQGVRQFLQDRPSSDHRWPGRPFK